MRMRFPQGVRIDVELPWPTLRYRIYGSWLFGIAEKEIKRARADPARRSHLLVPMRSHEPSKI